MLKAMTHISNLYFRERGVPFSQSGDVKGIYANYEVYNHNGARLGNSSSFFFLGGSSLNFLISYPEVLTLSHIRL